MSDKPLCVLDTQITADNQGFRFPYHGLNVNCLTRNAVRNGKRRRRRSHMS